MHSSRNPLANPPREALRIAQCNLAGRDTKYQTVCHLMSSCTEQERDTNANHKPFLSMADDGARPARYNGEFLIDDPRSEAGLLFRKTNPGFRARPVPRRRRERHECGPCLSARGS